MPDRTAVQPAVVDLGVVDPTVFEPTLQILAGVVLAQIDLLRSTVPPPDATPRQALDHAADALEHWARQELGPTAWDAFVAAVRLRAAREGLRYGMGGGAGYGSRGRASGGEDEEDQGHGAGRGDEAADAGGGGSSRSEPREPSGETARGPHSERNDPDASRQRARARTPEPRHGAPEPPREDGAP